MEFNIKLQNLAMILLLNWAVTSTKEVDMDYLWYPLVMKELLRVENFSTNVCCLFTNNERVGTNFFFFFVRRTKKRIQLVRV
jgi:hypothetical protein